MVSWPRFVRWRSCCITGSNALSGIYPEPGQGQLLPGRPLRRARSHRSVGHGRLRSPSESGTQSSSRQSLGRPASRYDTWYFKAGLRERWTHLGHTVLYGEYLRNDDGNNLNIAARCSQRSRRSMPTTARCTSGVLVWCRKSTLPPCRCGSATVTCRSTITSAVSAATWWRCCRRVRTVTWRATRDFQYIKFGGLINF